MACAVVSGFGSAAKPTESRTVHHVCRFERSRERDPRDRQGKAACVDSKERESERARGQAVHKFRPVEGEVPNGNGGTNPKLNSARCFELAWGLKVDQNEEEPNWLWHGNPKLNLSLNLAHCFELA